MKALVLGATGMAGHVTALYLQEQGHQVVTYSRRPFDLCPNITGDLFDEVFLRELLLGDDYDVVINCIGVLNQDADEHKSSAVYLNSYLPHLIVHLLKDSSTKLIHLSTDCVFSGSSGPYYETSLRDGVTFYDRTKALGEVEDANHLTLRTSIIGPDLTPQGIGLFNWFMSTGSDPIQGYIKAIWTGVTVITLAEAVEAAALQNLSGIYHLVNNTSINKYDLLRLFNQYFKDSTQQITPSAKLVTDKSLINTRTDFNFSAPSYGQMIADMKTWITDHPYLYPQYLDI